MNNIKPMPRTLTRNVQQGSFLLWMMSRKQLSMTLIAKSYDCTPDAVSKVLWGQLKSAALEEFIANVLGFKSWEALKAAEAMFNQDTDRYLKDLSA